MAQHNIYFVPKYNDRFVIDVFVSAVSMYGKNQFHCSTAAGSVFSGLPNEANQANIGEAWDWVLQQDQMLLTYISLSIGNFNVAFSRGGSQNPKSPIYDEVSFTYNDQGGEPSDIKRLEILTLFCNGLKSFDPQRTDVNTGYITTNTTAALHESMLARLEQLNEDIIRKTNETRNELELDYKNKRFNLEKELQGIKNELNRAHDEALASLKEKENEFQEHKNKLDDRGNTHARRELRNNMLADVKSRIDQFGVSELTRKKRYPIAAVLIFALIILAYLIYSNISEINHLIAPNYFTEPSAGSSAANEKLLYIILFRLSISTIAFTGTAIYFVRWQNRWADQHSTAEFQLQQFYIDVNRANWVIESGLEWKKETENEIPESILISVTKNLFRMQDEVSPTLHPADELASALLGTASKLKLKSGENELEFNSPGKIVKNNDKDK